MKKSLAAIALIVVASGAAFAASQAYHPASASSLASYTDAASGFSFRYPAGLIASKNGSSVDISTARATSTVVASVMLFAFPHFLQYEANATQTSVDKIAIGPYTGYKVAYWGAPAVSGFAVPLEDGEDPSYFIMVAKYGPETSGISTDQAEAIAASLVFDRAKLRDSAARNLEESRLADLDARDRAELESVGKTIRSRVSATKGYLGLCDPKAESVSLSCRVSKDAFAISAKLSSGAFACIDSSGFSGPVPALATTTSCK